MARISAVLFRRGAIVFAGLALCAAALGGCIRSRVNITSTPTGADVIWRGKPYGATPVTIPFIWYWYYDLALEAPGYKRLEAVERLRTPPWFLIPLDFFMEIIPVPFTDTRERHYNLTPVEPSEALTGLTTEKTLKPDMSALDQMMKKKK